MGNFGIKLVTSLRRDIGSGIRVSNMNWIGSLTKLKARSGITSGGSPGRGGIMSCGITNDGGGGKLGRFGMGGMLIPSIEKVGMLGSFGKAMLIFSFATSAIGSSTRNVGDAKSNSNIFAKRSRGGGTGGGRGILRFGGSGTPVTSKTKPVAGVARGVAPGRFNRFATFSYRVSRNIECKVEYLDLSAS